MSDERELIARFEEHRPRMKAVAYRMLGSFTDAEDAVQETWIRLSRSDATVIDNLGGWLTTVIGRICLDMLRVSKARSELAIGVQVLGPMGNPDEGLGPEEEALLADSLGLALLVVLNVLTPAERLAFVLHDMFKVSFNDIGTVMERSPGSAKMLASRARQRVRGVDHPGMPSLDRQREVVRAFLNAARGGSLVDLVGVLDPDATLQVDTTPLGPVSVRGARAIAGRAVMFSDADNLYRPAIVSGAMGIVTIRDGAPVSVMQFAIEEDRVRAITIVLDPENVARLDIRLLDA